MVNVRQSSVSHELAASLCIVSAPLCPEQLRMHHLIPFAVQGELYGDSTSEGSDTEGIIVKVTPKQNTCNILKFNANLEVFFFVQFFHYYLFIY